MRRYLVIAYVRKHGWHQHPDQRRFFTHSGALIFAVQANRRDAYLGQPRVEWRPGRTGESLRDPLTDKWNKAGDLPPWQGVDS